MRFKRRPFTAVAEVTLAGLVGVGILRLLRAPERVATPLGWEKDTSDHTVDSDVITDPAGLGGERQPPEIPCDTTSVNKCSAPSPSLAEQAPRQPAKTSKNIDVDLEGANVPTDWLPISSVSEGHPRIAEAKSASSPIDWSFTVDRSQYSKHMGVNGGVAKRVQVEHHARSSHKLCSRCNLELPKSGHCDNCD